ncbi:uncharacterized protein LOC127006801 isoform X1 [Eriocheir sinensis]|uniref:uncharacterized protein LOC127006801 isoform X1 n=1 Tax=Eriocheir sinensis TaxID=95602 RepID=UPI0021C78D98|nr:uncharacterized protein LOC127006801 isoform X1 [Eriocheir sinensis]
MKKTGTKAKNKSRINSVPCDDSVHIGDPGKDDGTMESVLASVHPGDTGVKLKAEGHAGSSGGLLETVEEVVEAPWGDMPGPDLSQAYVVDLTQQFNRVFVQTTFNSFKEFEMLFNKFKAETGSVFRIKSSCSIAYENSRRKKHLIPSRFKFVTVQYCCVHYGQPKVAGQGIRTKQRYLPCGCESMLSLSYNRGALVISQANMRHNHEVSSEMAPFYAINRRITNAELLEVAGAVEMIPNSRSLRHFLQIHFQRPTTLQDAKNVRARLKALKAPPVTSIAKPHVDEEQQFSPQEEEEKEEEEAMMECTEGGADDDYEEEEIEERVEGDTNYYGRQADRHKTSINLGQEEEQEQGCELDPRLKKEVISKIKERLHGTLEECDAQVFMKRLSVIDSLIEGWEKDNLNYAQNTKKSGRMGGLENTHSRNTHLAQERTGFTQNNRNANFQANIDNLNTSVPALGVGRTVFLPTQSNGKLVHLNNRNQSAFTNMEMNGRQNIMKFTPSFENSVNYSRADEQMSRIGETNERKPIILSIAKGLVDGEQPVEVEIEVDGEMAKVRAVKREPLDYHEVNVGDYW